MLEFKKIPEYRLTQDLVNNIKAPKIKKVEDVDFVIESIADSIDRNRPMGKRIASFISGQSKLSRGIGSVLDFITVFLPFGQPIDKLRTIIQRKLRSTMPKRIKPFLKQVSTWEGIALGAGAIGIFVSPEAATMIVGGIFSIVAGIKLWQKEAEGE
jgi:hypothetical protein